MASRRRNISTRTVLGVVASAIATMVIVPVALGRQRAAAGPPTAGTLGVWAAPEAWPTIAIHSAVLPNGKILTWGSTSGTTQADVWDPVTNKHTTVAEIPYALFCSGHTLLADGQVLIPGGNLPGNNGIIQTHVFDPETMTFQRGPDMNAPRWYPGTVTLGTGDVLIVGGHQSNAETNWNTLPQVYEPATGSLRNLTTADRPFGPTTPTRPTGTDYLSGYYPRMHLVDDGRVYMPGDSGLQSWLTTSGTGSWADRTATTPVVRSYNNSVLFDSGKALVVGGSLGNDITAGANIIDIKAGTITPTSPMTIERKWQNSVVLPTGNVLTVGGESQTGPAPAEDPGHAAVLYAESWDPATGQWTRRGDYTKQRFYHSTAVLLPDGRVMSAGGGQGLGFADQRNAEIYTPWYLYKSDGSGELAPRPSIESVSPTLAYGQPFSIKTSANIARVTLVRLNATTHAQDQNQRFIELPISARGNGSITSALGANRNAMPPGHYMLSIVDQAGVPSISAIVKVGDVGETPPTTTTTAAATTTTAVATTTTAVATTTTAVATTTTGVATTTTAVATTTSSPPACNAAPTAKPGTTDTFATADTSRWWFSPRVTAGLDRCGNAGARSIGSGTDWSASMSRNDTQGTGTRHTIQFLADRGDSQTHIAVTTPDWQNRLQVVVRNNQLAVEAQRGGQWFGLTSFPWSVNTWFEVGITIDDAAGFKIDVQNLANGQSWSRTEAMPKGLQWRFFHGNYVGTTWLDNYTQSTVAVVPTGASDLVVYDDAVRNSFDNWSWNSRINTGNTKVVKVGATAIAITPTRPWSGLSYRSPRSLTATNYRSLSFWANGGTRDHQLRIYLQSDNGRAGQVKNVTIPANQWVQIVVPMSELSGLTTFTRVSWQDASGSTQPTWYLDEVRFVAA
jgi:Domain of unknown function (DUF1929)